MLWRLLMLICKTLRLFGSAAAKKKAKLILENQPQIKRIDSCPDPDTLKLLFDSPQNEKSLLPLLADCGISGFRLE